MKLIAAEAILALPSNSVVPISTEGSVRLTCLSGLIWLTVDGKTEDLVLEDDDAIEIGLNQGIVIQALRKTVIAVEEATNKANRLAAFARLVHRWLPALHAAEDRAPLIARKIASTR